MNSFMPKLLVKSISKQCPPQSFCGHGHRKPVTALPGQGSFSTQKLQLCSPKSAKAAGRQRALPFLALAGGRRGSRCPPCAHAQLTCGFSFQETAMMHLLGGEMTPALLLKTLVIIFPPRTQWHCSGQGSKPQGTELPL